jgi:uncharacterized protein YndB with AHSA1/START domain
MGRRTVSVDIAAPPHTVYSIYSDGARWSEWQPRAKNVVTSGPLGQVGSRLTASYGGPFKIKGEVIAVAPDRSHAMRFVELAGLITCVTTARFEPQAGGTRLEMTFDYKPKIGFLDRMAGNEMVAAFAKDGALLKAIAERAAG